MNTIASANVIAAMAGISTNCQVYVQLHQVFLTVQQAELCYYSTADLPCVQLLPWSLSEREYS